jgi:hypothetical protein
VPLVAPSSLVDLSRGSAIPQMAQECKTSVHDLELRGLQVWCVLQRPLRYFSFAKRSCCIRSTK